MAFAEPLLVVGTAPATLPVTLAEAKAACRVEAAETFEDGYIGILMAAATELLDGRAYLGQAIVGQQWLALYSPGSGTLELPLGPVSAVDGVEYVDAAGALQTLALDDLRVRKDRWRCLVTPKSGSWPAMAAQEDALQVMFTAGGASAPAPVKLAVLTIVAFWFDHRDGGISDRLPDQIWKAIEALLVNERAF